jgi:hypothetical protein
MQLRIITLNRLILCGNYNIDNKIIGVRGGVMVFNATINNISVISWRSALLLEETGVSVYVENHRHAVSDWQTLSHNAVRSTRPHEWDSNSQQWW